MTLGVVMWCSDDMRNKGFLKNSPEGFVVIGDEYSPEKDGEDGDNEKDSPGDLGV